ncbi:MAG: long-chain fatty acid--CoA ligase, partial [Bacteroidales bacterium]|nr:long-chain fatty acid--CoA ligase [Bacteroidales bacterium]
FKLLKMSVTRTFYLLERYRDQFIKPDVLAAKKDGEWIKYSTQDYIDFSWWFASGLLELGYNKGDKIITVSNNRPEWNFVDMGMALVGVVHVPVYPTIGPDEYLHILEHSDARSIIISDRLLLNKIRPVLENVKTLEAVYTFNNLEAETNWSEIVESGRINFKKNKPIIEDISGNIRPEDIVTLIYTSGTTGTPKGVMLSHQNLVTNFIATSKVQPLDHRHKVLSFLPLCHVYERMMNYHFQYRGISIYYAENLGTVSNNLKEIKADGFNSVPRLLEKVYDKIVATGKDLPGIKKRIFFWALNLGLRYELSGRSFWYDWQRSLADKLVYKKWREALGGEIKIIVSGGSALQPRLARLFWAAGMRVMEGYGLTETAPVIAVSWPDYPNLKFGTVGPVLEGVEVKFDDDGEILVKGPNVMKGYYKDPEATSNVIDEDGWFHTGDVGYLDEGKFLKITDRKKEMFKLSAGKYIAPQSIENKFKESIFIEQIMVVGENEKFASALISPNFNHLHFWASKHKIHYRDNEELINLPEVLKRMSLEVEKVNKTLGSHEQIKRFRMVCEEWSPQTGGLSPTLKLKRNVISRKYHHILEEIYGYSRQNGNPKTSARTLINLPMVLRNRIINGITKITGE